MSDQNMYIDEMDLGYIHLLKGVNRESVKGLLDLCTIQDLQPEEILLSPARSNRTVYLLLSGQLRVHLHSIDTDPIALLDPGESVGEMSTIDHQMTSAFVVANKPCKILAMDEDILWSLVQSSHDAACNLLFILVKRLRHTDAVIASYAEIGDQYEQYGSVDALTGLHNRHWLDNMLKRLCARSSTDNKPLSLIMIDIDHFKEFNDHFGHLYGDHVLYSVARTISDLLRPTEIIARYGGDEFIVLLPDLDITVAKMVAERLHRGVMERIPAMPDGRNIPHPTISVGVAEMQTGQTPEMLIDAADKALYRAKDMGRNCIAV
ncbi:MAG: GGDEF domain-containing protein [Deltaproteobacteria bacterium]|nr:GGDEF domain-containing protein [Deltaproteobacteria bacterium]